MVLLFTPLPSLLMGAGEARMIGSVTDHLRTLLDIGFIGFLANSLVFFLVSLWTSPVDPVSRRAFAHDLEGSRR